MKIARIYLRVSTDEQGISRQAEIEHSSRPSKGLPLTSADRTKRKIRHLDTAFLFRSCMPYSYVQFLSRPQLEWSMVLDARRRIADMIAVHDAIAKKRGGRLIPMHPELADALQALKQRSGFQGPVVRSSRGDAMRPNSIVNWFVKLFAALHIEGCSSHSGRRSFITAAARNVHRAGCSLRDVQLLAGHRSIDTTQRYIDGYTAGQRKLVSLL